MTPNWLLDAVAVLMLAVAAVSAARLVAERPWRRGAVVIDTDLAHLLMATAMAGMLARGLHTLPDVPWEVVFGLLAAWFAMRVASDARTNGASALAGGHCVPHLVHSCSMLYMFLAMAVTSPGAGMAGMTAGSAMTLSYPTLALLFAFILVGYSIWDLDQLSGRRYSLATPRVSLAGPAAPCVPVPGLAAGRDTDDRCDTDAGHDTDAGRSVILLSPAVTIGCRVAMGVAMAFMLFIAI